MNSDVSRQLYSNRATQVVYPQAPTSVVRSTIWRQIASFATPDEIWASRQVSKEMRDAVDRLDLADLFCINERCKKSRFDLCKLDNDQIITVSRHTGDREVIARHPEIPPALQLFLANPDDPFNPADVRRALARNRNLTVKVQKILAQDKDAWGGRAKLAGNSNLKAEVQEILLEEDDDYFVLCSLAGNLKLTPAVQRILAQEHGQDVRMELASNSNLTDEVQEILAQDEKPVVRRILARNPTLTSTAQKILVQDKNLSVRKCLASNYNLTAAARQLLDQSSRPWYWNGMILLTNDEHPAPARRVNDATKVTHAKKNN